MLQPVRGEVRKVLNRGAEMSVVLCRHPLRHAILRRGNIYEMHGGSRQWFGTLKASSLHSRQLLLLKCPIPTLRLNQKS